MAGRPACALKMVKSLPPGAGLPLKLFLILMRLPCCMMSWIGPVQGQGAVHERAGTAALAGMTKSCENCRKI